MHVVAQALSNGSQEVFQQWVSYGKSCIQPGLQYFLDKFSHELGGCVSAFKAAQLCLPSRVKHPTADTVDMLKVFPFLDKPLLLDTLEAELPTYLAKVDSIDSAIDPLTWWKANAIELPTWPSVTADILLVQPSSAAAERVFSLLKASFGPQQDSALNDYIETSLMLQYNKDT